MSKRLQPFAIFHDVDAQSSFRFSMPLARVPRQTPIQADDRVAYALLSSRFAHASRHIKVYFALQLVQRRADA